MPKIERGATIIRRHRIATTLCVAAAALGTGAAGASAAAPSAPSSPSASTTRSAPLVDVSNLVRLPDLHLPDITILSPSQSQSCAGEQQQTPISQQQTCAAD